MKMDLEPRALVLLVVGGLLLLSASGFFATVSVPSLTGAGFDIELLDNQYCVRDTSNMVAFCGLHLRVNNVDLGKIIIGRTDLYPDGLEKNAEGQVVFKNAYGGPQVIGEGDYSLPAGQNEFVQNSGVGLSERFVDSRNNLGFDFAGLVETLFLKTQKLSLSKTYCPRTAGTETVYAQVFDGSKQEITLADFKYPVKFFCFSLPAVETLPSGNSVTNPYFYSDLVFKGSTVIPPGETVTMFAVVDGGLLPQFCPEGQVVQNGACVSPDVTLQEKEISFVHQNEPVCAENEFYDENLKKCISTAPVPESAYVDTLASGAGTFLNESKGTDYCKNSVGGQYVFKDGKCVTGYEVLQERKVMMAGGLGSVAGIPLLYLIVGALAVIAILAFVKFK